MNSRREAIAWDAGVWTHQPADVSSVGPELIVTAREGSDAWHHTSYGFVHDDEHALLAPFPLGRAMEAEFTADFHEQFDQAGIFVRASSTNWVKAGVEFVDGALQLGAVVTNPNSDWSVAPVPDWADRRILLRVSRDGDALTVRAKVVDEPSLRLVRVVPLDPELIVHAGPFVCAPTRAGLRVHFHSWQLTAADESLH